MSVIGNLGIFMFTRDNASNKIIYVCKDTELNEKDVKKIKKVLKNNSQKELIVNLKKVSSIKQTILNHLKEISEENRLSLCCLNSDIMAVLNLLEYDAKFKLYLTEDNGLENKYEIKNRRFKLV